MRIALVSEGTYPFAVGGVSTWCDQLIRGMPDCQWQMVALTVDGTPEMLWPRPSNLEEIRTVPLWGACPSPRHNRSGWGMPQPGREGPALVSYEALLRAMLAPQEPGSDEAVVSRSRFLLALRGIYEYASTGGHLCTALTGNAGLAMLAEVWRECRGTQLSLAHAIEAANLMAHMLRPLAMVPVECSVVHVSMNGLSMLAAMVTKWRHGTPIVLSEHGVYLRERYLEHLDLGSVPGPVRVLLLSFFRSLAAASYLIADALAPHSSYNSRWQLCNGADPDRVWTMYNGVSPERFPVAEQEPDRPTIVFMGRISPIKDIHTLIRAFVSVRAEVPNALLRIFGSTAPTDRGYEHSCRRLIEELDLSGSVVLEGAVESPVTAYHAGTVVALTSISEGFPVAVIEAMACGRPIVYTNVGGVVEAVADAGIAVAPRDPRAVARACVTLLADHELRARMAAIARARVLRHFTLDESIAAYRRIYDSVTGAVEPSPVPAATVSTAAEPPRETVLPVQSPERIGPSEAEPPSIPQSRRRAPASARGGRPRALGRVRVSAGGLG